LGTAEGNGEIVVGTPGVRPTTVEKKTSAKKPTARMIVEVCGI
jgi:hypothetical protein